MALSDATTGFGTTLSVDVGAGPVVIAEIIEISELPSGDRELYETTSMDSVDYKEFKKHPLKEGREISVSLNYVLGSETAETLKAADDALEALPCVFTAPQGNQSFTFTGRALLYGLSRMNPMSERRTQEITMKPVEDFVEAEVV